MEYERPFLDSVVISPTQHPVGLNVDLLLKESSDSVTQIYYPLYMEIHKARAFLAYVQREIDKIDKAKTV